MIDRGVIAIASMSVIRLVLEVRCLPGETVMTDEV